MEEEEIDIFIKRLSKVLEKAKSEEIDVPNGKHLVFMYYYLKLVLFFKVHFYY